MTALLFVPDLPTILVMTIFVFATQAFFLAQLYRIKRRRAFAYLAIGCAAFALGFLCYFLRPWLGRNLLTVPVADLLITAYPVLLLVTLMECHGVARPHRAFLWSLPAIAVMMYTTTVYLSDGLLAVIVVSAVDGLFYLFVAGYIVRRLPLAGPGMMLTFASNLILAVALFGRTGVALVLYHGMASPEQAPVLAIWLSYTLLVALFCLSAQIYGLPLQEFTRSEQALRHLASVDPLTEALNRRSFLLRSAALWEDHRRRALPLAALMLDLDRFKSINDRHGHATGDRVIVAFCRLLHDALRHGDVLGRMGGEEFAIVLPDVTAAQAGEIAERIRSACEGCRVLADDGFQVPVTVSIGLVQAGDADSLDDLLKQADRAMYLAKAQGRNRVVAWAAT